MCVCAYVHTYILLQNVVNITSHPSSHSYTLFVFTVALWDTICEWPLLPTVKQDYWGCPLLSSLLETTIALSETHKRTKKHRLARTAKAN